MKVELKGLSAGYDGEKVLNDVNLNIEGGFVGVLGPNGSGKTTLLRVISGILKPMSGMVRINGVDIHKANRKTSSRLVTMVSQDFTPMYEYRVIEVVKMAFASGSIFPSRDEDEKALAALQSLGIKDLSGRFFSELSGGEKRMVMLARALAQESKVILVDELELHLDPAHKKWISEMLKRTAESGRTVIAVFHDIQLASAYANRFVGILNGKVIFDEKDLKTSDLEKLYLSSFREVDGVVLPWY